MNITIAKVIPALMVAGLLLSCTTSASIKETWKNPEVPETSYRKLLVVGIAYDDNVRQMFENMFVDTLHKHGVEAVPSHNFIGTLEKVNLTQLHEMALKAGADAVVVTHGVSKSERAEYQYATGTLERKSVVMEKSGPDSSTTIEMSGVGIVPHETDFEVATLETKFFDASNDKLVWSSISSISDAGDRADTLWKLTAKLVKALEKDKLIASH